MPTDTGDVARKPDPKRCLRCRGVMTWAAVRVQYGRMVKRGPPDAHTRRAVPRCQKCVTRLLRGIE